MNRLLNWLRRQKLENSLDRELNYHFDRRVDEFRRQGVTQQEARRQARLELGVHSLIQEEVRDVWLSKWMRDFAYDLRFSARSFVRSPAFTATAVISLALGIGATTAIYSLVDQVLLHSLPVRDPGRLVLVDWKGDQVASGFGSWNLMSYPICRDLDERTEVFDGVFCRALTTVNLTIGTEPKPITAEVVSGTYFSVLGVGASAGRVFAKGDDGGPNANPVVVLSFDFWKNQLGGVSDVVGMKILVNQHPMRVIGVAAANFKGIDVGEVPSLWIPASMSAQAIPKFESYLDRRTRWMQVLGRLKPGLSVRRAQVALQPWFKAMLHEDTRRTGFPNTTLERRQAFLNSSLVLTPAPQGHSSLRRKLLEPLWVLLVVTLVLLSLACLNVAGLFLARGSARDREIGTRLALGASPGRLSRQLLADSLLLSLAGGILGLILAPAAVRGLVAFLPKFLPEDSTQSALQASVNGRLLLFAFGLTLTAGLLSGLAPAWQAGRKGVMESLRDRAVSSGGARLRKLIVTTQITLTLVLITGAVLFSRTLSALMTKGPGFFTSSLVSFTVDPLRSGYSPEQANRATRRIGEAIRQSPVTQSSAVARFPLLTGGSWNDSVTIQTDRRITSDRDVNLNAVSPGFFTTLGVKILAGRDFDNQDRRPPGEVGERVAIVNEAFVRRYIGSHSPLGARICQGSGPDAKPNVEIIGVVPDFSYRGIREESEQVYFSFDESEGSFASFYVRLRGSPDAAVPVLRAIVRDIDPSLPIMNFHTLAEQVDRSLVTERIMAILSRSFGLIALLLSLVGLYGVMSFVVVRRTREIGIRLALGATRSSALWLVLRDALAMIGIGICVALPFVWALGRLVESQLYGVNAADPRLVGAAIAILAAAGLASALIPARRASTVDPMSALRED